MGRKKKKVEKPWCWYCNRDFEDDKILIQHQKAKHFKCHMCHKKLFSGPGLAIHCMQVHKETIDKIPGAVVGRDSTEIEIYGMQGIPDDATRGVANEYEDMGGAAKRPRMDVPYTFTMPGMPGAGGGAQPGGIPMPPMPGMPGGAPPFPGMPPFGMPPGMPPFPPPGMAGLPPPPFIPPPYGMGRGAPPPGGPWGPPGGGPMGPPPGGMPPRMGLPMPPSLGQPHISGQSTVPSSYSDRLAQERSDRAPIPEGPLAVGGYDNGAPKQEVKHEGDGDWANKTSSQLSAKIRIVHPDDHSISLEERRLNMLASRSSSHAAGYNYRQ